MMSIIFRAAGKALPAQRCTNDDLSKKIDTTDEWIRSHTGIGARYLASEEETSSYLGTKACKQALEKAGVAASEVDLIICSTATTDYNGFPSNACLMQESLEAVNAACFDLSAACSGFIYGLDCAEGLMLRHNWKYALVCGSEILSNITDWTDRSTCVLFGDAAGAVLLENKPEAGTQGLGSFILGAQGTGSKFLYNEYGGKLTMDGHAVYDFAVGIMTKIIKDLMEKENLTEHDVDFFVCHQANERILKASARRLGFKIDKFIFNMEEYGNTSSASIPITLVDMEERGQLQKGMTVVSAAFGAGLTYSGCVFRW
jgi:3-oxoacyl-[acyl-carrier-protein] synthase-3